jgi:hypothetical protein
LISYNNDNYINFEDENNHKDHLNSNENVDDENEELSRVDSFEYRDQMSNVPSKTP